MKDFTELDAAIIARIRGGYTRFYEIWPLNAEMRVVDRRLQALRKKGLIACRGQKWYVVSASTRGAG